jgi:hypothetical protein
MPKRPIEKECIDIRVCIDPETNKEINKFQARRRIKDGLPYPKFEAASDYFNGLSKKDREGKSN